MSRSARLVPLGLAVVLLAACENEPIQPGPPLSSETHSAARAPGILHPGEAEFEEVSKVVPSFAGFFLEGPDLITYVTDLGQAQAAQSAVRRALAEHFPRTADPRLANGVMSVRSAHYTFSQLRDWRNAIEPDLFGIPDAAWIDLDEAGNQVAIGLADGSGRAQVAALLARLEVPQEAARIEVTGRDVPNDALLGRVRPVEGGLANAVSFNGIPGSVPWCTLGFNAQYNGVNVVLTASHCTYRIYRGDAVSTVFYQDSVKGADQIGSEYYDPQATIACASP